MRFYDTFNRLYMVDSYIQFNNNTMKMRSSVSMATKYTNAPQSYVIRTLSCLTHYSHPLANVTKLKIADSVELTRTLRNTS